MKILLLCLSFLLDLSTLVVWGFVLLVPNSVQLQGRGVLLTGYGAYRDTRIRCSSVLMSLSIPVYESACRT